MYMTPEDGHTTLRANQLLQEYFPEAFPAEKQPLLTQNSPLRNAEAKLKSFRKTGTCAAVTAYFSRGAAFLLDEDVPK